MLANTVHYGHLVGRSVAESEWTLTHLNGEPTRVEVPPFYLGLWIITAVVFGVCLMLFDYAYYNVFITLCMVEEPTSTILLHEESNEPLNAQDPTKPADEEVLIVKNAPITSSIRRLRKHLRDTCGPLASFRGLGLYICYNFVIGLLTQIVALPLNSLGSFIAAPIAGIIVTILLSRWLMTWTHIVISEPSPLRWWRRVPSSKTWKKILPATATFAIARYINAEVIVLTLSRIAANPEQYSGDSGEDVGHMATVVSAQVLGVFGLNILSTIFLVIPSTVALVRTHASLLPEATEAIIPYDRSYGGKVIPEITGGKGCLELRDALMSVDRPTVVRIVKMYLKIFALQVALWFVFIVCIGIEFGFAKKHIIIHKGDDDPVIFDGDYVN